MHFKTADLFDAFSSEVDVAESWFNDYGEKKCFFGPMATARVWEDNVLVNEFLETDGEGRVLVVDGGKSLGCALMGDRLATLAHDNNWAGLLVNGCIRDSDEIRQIPIGVKALNTSPRKSKKRGLGDKNVQLHFAGITFHPGHYLYSDSDGIIVAQRELLESPEPKVLTT